MKDFSRLVLLGTAILIAAPALATDPDPHAGHHPATAAPATPQTTPAPGSANAQQGCPMMSGKAMPGQMAGTGTATAPMGGGTSGMMAGHTMPDGMMDRKAMPDSKMAGCMQPASGPATNAAPPK